MKTILLILAACAAIGSGQPDFSAVINTIKSGKSTSIAPYLANEVEITIGGNDGTYSKAEALTALQNFYNQNKPTNCSMVHNGVAKDQEAYYCIGKLDAGGKSYRLYIYFKKTGEQYLIQEMRFEDN